MTVLSLRNVEKSYPHPSGEVAVLKGVDLNVNPGKSLAILGPSGCGKSTLLALLAGLDFPSQGQIEILGKDITSMTEDKLAKLRSREVGIVFQQFHLMEHLTAQENVELPVRIQGGADYQTEARVALSSVGLSERRDHFPRELSGGECQRVAIARAIVGRPKILLADEPSGNLDEVTGKQVMDLLFQVVTEHQVTLILVTHNQMLAGRCDEQKTIRDGKLYPWP
jgi:putative ABC transport system ATP-binding protein